MGGNALSGNVLGPGISAVLTTTGDLLFRNAAGEVTRLPIGAANEVLKTIGGLPDWEPDTAAILTTNGDLLYRNAAGVVTRLPIGSATEILTVVGGVPDWEPPAAAGLAYKLVDAGAFGFAGGYMTDAYKLANVTLKTYGGVSGGPWQFPDRTIDTGLVDYASYADLQGYPYIVYNMAVPTALDGWRLRNIASTDHPVDFRIWGSATGAFTGEEEAVYIHTAFPYSNPLSVADFLDALHGVGARVYRYWKMRGYKAAPNWWRCIEVDFRFAATLVLSNIPYGCKCSIYSGGAGGTLKETHTQNVIYGQGSLMFVEPNANFDAIVVTEPDAATVALTVYPFTTALGDVWTLIP